MIIDHIDPDELAMTACQEVAAAQSWQAGGYDCWRLVRNILGRACGLRLPALPVSAQASPDAYAEHCAITIALAESHACWIETAARPGAVALVRQAHRPRAHHVALCLADDIYAHCAEKSGPTVGRWPQMHWQGWRIVRHVIHADLCTTTAITTTTTPAKEVAA